MGCGSPPHSAPPGLPAVREQAPRWACAVSFWNINPWIANGGDQLRNSLLFVSPSAARARCGACSRYADGQRAGPVPGWPVKVLIVQLCCIYFFSGIHKLVYPQWQDSTSCFVNHDLTWSLAPNLTSLLPVAIHKLSTWLTLAWEIGFPLLIVHRLTRTATLVLGVIFHLVTLFTLEVGAFAIYSLVFYVVFVPWEGLRRRPDDGGQ